MLTDKTRKIFLYLTEVFTMTFIVFEEGSEAEQFKELTHIWRSQVESSALFIYLFLIQYLL